MRRYSYGCWTYCRRNNAYNELVFKKLKENINPIAAAKHSILSSGSGSIIAGLVLIIGFYAAAIPVEWVAFTVTANFIAVAIASSLIIQFFCLIPYLILSNTAKFKAAA